MRGAAAVFGAVALALAAPRCAAAAEADPELRRSPARRRPRPAGAGASLSPAGCGDRPRACGSSILRRPPRTNRASGPGMGSGRCWSSPRSCSPRTSATGPKPASRGRQYELTWEDQKKRLLELEGVRFDSNAFQTNWTHAYAGAIYYSLGRINNLGVGESFLLSAFSSLYWETVVEWKEVFSVNDTIVTDFGGPLHRRALVSALALSPLPAEPGGEHPRVHPPPDGPARGARPRLPPPSHRQPDPPRARGLPLARRRDHRLALSFRHRRPS